MQNCRRHCTVWKMKNCSYRVNLSEWLKTQKSGMCKECGRYNELIKRFICVGIFMFDVCCTETLEMSMISLYILLKVWLLSLTRNHYI
jgi:uncharacterized membrane protein